MLLLVMHNFCNYLELELVFEKKITIVTHTSCEPFE